MDIICYYVLITLNQTPHLIDMMYVLYEVIFKQCPLC